ncbi:MAG: triosephosphate isomerase (TIM) [Parcubacteria group bacterium Gr01-1014_44]|nr:MAG: triosephosphate isomerase (TIM) [Parcubacteria group bacterium Gr01-1014_44]
MRNREKAIMYKKIIIANWKANPGTLLEAQALFSMEASAAEQYAGVETVICPPFIFLEELARITRHIDISTFSLGAQDIETPTMLKNFGVSHVLVGHSDRRYGLGETDEVVNQKLKIALEAGIIPVLLVGEKERGESRESILAEQLEKDLAGLLAEQAAKILFTYEPVWAISTGPGGQADTPESALEAIKFIREFLTTNYKLQTINCLYGGSVNEQNATDFLRHPEINGAVVGGASLDAVRFSKILEVVSNFQP